MEKLYDCFSILLKGQVQIKLLFTLLHAFVKSIGEEELSKFLKSDVYKQIKHFSRLDNEIGKLSMKLKSSIITPFDSRGSSRGAKIRDMSNLNSTADINTSPKDGLFQNSFNQQISPPIRKRGSFLGKNMQSPSSARNSNKQPLNIDEMSNSNFVAIDAEVRIDPDKQTEHQREMAKKRRDDIPALYEDLSQSSNDKMEKQKIDQLLIADNSSNGKVAKGLNSE